MKANFEFGAQRLIDPLNVGSKTLPPAALGRTGQGVRVRAA